MNRELSSPPNESKEMLASMQEKRCYFNSRLTPLDLEDASEQYEDEQPRSDKGKNILDFINLKNIVQKKRLASMQSLNKKHGFSTVWKHGALRIIYLISRFLQVLKTSTDQYKFKLINRKIMRIIGDSTVNYEYYQLKGLIHDKPSKLKMLQLRCLPNFTFRPKVIMPDDTVRVVFDGIVLALIILIMFYIPLRVSFYIDESDIPDGTSFLLDRLPSIIFILEIVLKFNTAYFEGGILHSEHKQIVKHYLKGDLLGDVIVVLPFILNLHQLDLILLLRILSISRLVESLEECTSIRERFAAPLDLAKLIFNVIFVSHICACIWSYIGVWELTWNDTPNVWIRKYGMEDASWQSLYMFSFYWSTITTLTVGYGDITPVNDFERAVCCLIVLICSIVFGYNISSIGKIFTQISEKNTRYKNSMAQMTSYIKKRKLNKQLQTKVKKYFEFLFQSDQYQNEECEQQMEQLSTDLKRQVKIDIYKRILNKSTVLQSTFSEEFLNSLCLHVHARKFTPGEVIFQQNSLLNQLYFIVSGDVQVHVDLPNNVSNLRKYTIGYVLGLRNFLTQTPVKFSCRAVQFVEVAHLNYDDFYTSLADFPDDLEKFALIKDNLTFNPQYKRVNEVCQICLLNHKLTSCPFTFYQANRTKILRDNEVPNIRQFQQRRPKRSLNCYLHKKDYQINALDVCFDNGLLREDEVDTAYELKLGIGEKQSFILASPKDSQTIKSKLSYKDCAQPSPAKEIRRQNSKKRSVMLDPLKFMADGPKNKKMFTIYSDPETEKKFDMLDEVALQFMEQYIKEDPLPSLDQFADYKYFYNSQNLNQVILKQNEQHSKKRIQRRHKKPISRPLSIRGLSPPKPSSYINQSLN